MTGYVAFLRAINVGGTSIIKMEDLRQMFESFGLANVQTYIQSGNVIFESKENDPSVLERRVESQLAKALGHKVGPFLRAMQEVALISTGSPFKPKESETLHVVFLHEKPDSKSEAALMSFRSKADDFAIREREVYNLRRDREQSVFSNNFIEKTLALLATTRNITTVNKLIEKYK